MPATDSQPAETDSSASPAPDTTQSTPDKADPKAPATNQTKEAGSKTGNRKRAERPRVSQAVVSTRLHLRSRHAQQVFTRGYNTAARAFYTLSVMLRIYVSNPEAEQVGALADQMLTEVREELDNEIARMKQVVETEGMDPTAITYTKPVEYEVEINTPKAGQYLALIRRMDEFISLMDLLWLSGVYTDTQYNAGSYQWQRRLIKFANRLRNLAQRAMALARDNRGGDSGITDFLTADDSDDDAGDSGDDDGAVSSGIDSAGEEDAPMETKP